MATAGPSRRGTATMGTRASTRGSNGEVEDSLVDGTALTGGEASQRCSEEGHCRP